MSKTNLIALVCILVIIGSMVYTGTRPQPTTQKLSEDALILAFGDSLTYGKGAPGQSYPSQLEKMIGRKVVNAGLSGEPSSQGLLRLRDLLVRHKPQLVIICHGGNDLIRQSSKEQLRNNLVDMIRMSKEMGAQVLLVGLPDFKLVRFSTEPLYEEVAVQEGTLFEGDVLRIIENTAAYKSDRVHPNAKGYRLMAEAFVQVLKDEGLI